MPTSSHHDLEATSVKTTLRILGRYFRCTLWSMHDWPDSMADLGSHWYVWRPTLVLTRVRPCHIGQTLRKSHPCSLYLLAGILAWKQDWSVYLIGPICHLMSTPVPTRDGY